MSETPDGAVRTCRDSHRARFLGDLAKWSRLPSVSAQPGRAADVRRGARRPAARLQEAGVPSAGARPTAGAPAVLAERPCHAPQAPAVLGDLDRLRNGVGTATMRTDEGAGAPGRRGGRPGPAHCKRRPARRNHRRPGELEAPVTTWTDHTADRPISLTAPSGVDRAAHRRLDEPWLAAAWSHPSTRCFVVSSGQVLIDETPDGRTELVMTPSFEAPLTEAHRYFLGTDADGVSYFALQKDALPGRIDQSARPAGLREAGLLLSPRDAGLLVHAVALENWQRMHRFCSRCGERTVIAAAGHIRRCPACGAEHYPRTDPAVIMAVTDDDDRILLGRQLHWPEGRFSTLAGFVEPGESIEQSVRREVFEEVGVTIDEVRYVASQPWPFPSSLMLGFLAHASTTAIDVDGDEIHEARWFSREELRAAFESGEVLPPYGISIAARLIELWYGEPLPARSV